MSFKNSVLSLLAAVLMVQGAFAQTVIEDGGVGMSRQELEYYVKYWVPDMQRAAADDPVNRLELLNMALTNKRIAEQASKITPDSDPEAYWKHKFIARNADRKFVTDHFVANLDVPDMTELARERYTTEKDKYALVPERRYTSHILIQCMPPGCKRGDKRPLVESIQAELESGTPFEELVVRYSEDPGSKGKGGTFDRWLTRDDTKVDAYYLEGAFAIEQKGEFSGIVESKFGFHIIRLDDIEEAHYLPYEEVEERIKAVLRQEYVKLSVKAWEASYRLSDEVVMDSKALEEIFAPYKSVEASR
jgi:hypothetical protein